MTFSSTFSNDVGSPHPCLSQAKIWTNWAMSVSMNYTICEYIYKLRFLKVIQHLKSYPENSVCSCLPAELNYPPATNTIYIRDWKMPIRSTASIYDWNSVRGIVIYKSSNNDKLRGSGSYDMMMFYHAGHEGLWSKAFLISTPHKTVVLLIWIITADSRLVPSQWETSLQSNAVSHWLGASLECRFSPDNVVLGGSGWSWNECATREQKGAARAIRS